MLPVGDKYLFIDDSSNTAHRITDKDNFYLPCLDGTKGLCRLEVENETSMDALHQLDCKLCPECFSPIEIQVMRNAVS